MSVQLAAARIVALLQDLSFGLFKFGERRFMDRFIGGEVYMNTLEHFASEERNCARADRWEGNSHWLRSEDCVISIEEKGVYVPIGGLVGPIAYTSPRERKVNVFCMYALRRASPVVDSRNQNFGDTFVVVTHPMEFLLRIDRAAKDVGFPVDCGLVQYLDESTYCGYFGPFRKSSCFSYQSEYRIAIRANSSEPLTLNIGDIRDITKTGPLAELNERVRLPTCD